MTRRNELLKALETMPRDLARTLRGFTQSSQGGHTEPEQWTLTDVVNHLISVEIRYLARLQLVTKEDSPTIPFILPDPANHDRTISIDELLTRFKSARGQMMEFLQPLSTGIWARQATFEDGRKTTFRFLVQHLVDHDTEHLNQIIEIKNLLT
jgi:uncharacterized damage-inducible protein DinB